MSVVAVLRLSDEPSAPWDDGGQVDADNPWPGLAAFEERDKAFFHGRDDETRELVRALVANRFTLMFGRSGLGKSSLIKAGCFPELRKQGMLPVYIRLDYSDEHRTFSQQVRGAVLEAAAGIGATITAWPEGCSAWEYLHDRDTELWSAKNKPLRPLLVFDQYEEIFTKGGDAPASRRMFEELADLVEGRVPDDLRPRLDEEYDGPAKLNWREHDYHVLVSMREDYLADLEQLRSEMPSIASRRIRLVPLRPAQALDVVRKSGKDFVSVEVGELIVEWVARAGTADRPERRKLEVDPALLSLFCRQLNNRRLRRAAASGDRGEQITRDDVTRDRLEILKQFYERCLKDVPAHVAVFIEEKLLTESGHRDTEPMENARRAGLTDEIIDKLVKRRLLRLGDWSGRQRLELTHDVLTEVVKAAREERKRREEAEREERARAEQAAREEREREEQAAREEREREESEQRIAQRRAQEEARRQDQEKYQRRVRRMRLIAVSIALGAVFLFAVGMAAMRYKQRLDKQADRERDEYKHSVAPLKDLANKTPEARAATAPAVFDAVASYLWNAGRRERLLELLAQYASFIPEDYGVESAPAGSFGAEPPEEWPLTLEYSSSDRSALNHARLLAQWSRVVPMLRAHAGLVVPSRLRLAEQTELLPGHVRLVTWSSMQCANAAEAGNASSASNPAQERPAPGTPETLRGATPTQVTSSQLRGPQPEDHSLLSEEQVPAVLRSLFDREKAKWKKADLPKWLGVWYLVPRWTRPLWRMAGGTTLSYEAGLAMAAADELLKQPRLALSCDSLSSSLRAVERDAPDTLREALAARGGMEPLRKDLIAALGAGQSLVPLRYVLDALADYSATGPRVVAYPLPLPANAQGSGDRLFGPRALAEPALLEPHPAYEGGASERPEGQVRVYLGEKLSRDAAPGGGALDPRLQERMLDLRRSLFVSLGVMAPNPVFRDARQYRLGLATDAARIEVGADLNATSVVIRGQSSEAAISALSGEIGRRLERQPGLWTDSESVSASLGDVQPKLREWLRQHFSVTDLKNILRNVLGDGTETTRDQGGHLRDLDWLLGSLVFWRFAADDADDAREMAVALRATQRARTENGGAPAATLDSLTSLVAKGLRALDDGAIELAERSFRAALAMDRARARTVFAQRYAAQVGSWRAWQLGHATALPSLSARYDAEEDQRVMDLRRRFQIEQLLEHAQLSDEQRRALSLQKLRCLVAQGSTSAETRSLVTRLLVAAPPDAWRPDERLWLGIFALRAWRDSPEPPDTLAELRRLLASALTALGDRAARQVVLVDGGSKWLSDLFCDLAEQPGSEPRVVARFAYELVSGGYAQATRAHRLLGLLEKDGRPAAAEIRRDPSFDLAILQAVRSQAMEATPETLTHHVDDMRQRATTLCFGKTFVLARAACDALVDSWLLEEKYDDAAAALARINREQPDIGSDMQNFAFFIALARGDLNAARDATLPSSSTAGRLDFQRAVVALLADAETHAQTPNYDPAARRFIYGPVHDYQDYLRIMYWARLKLDHRDQDAKKLLDERVATTDRASWRARLRKGELGPWREMLITYCAGGLSEAELLNPLSADSAFAESPLSETPYTRRAFQAEGYFYDALKRRVTGPEADRKLRYTEALNEALATRYSLFFEYQFARLLLQQAGSGTE